MSKNEIDTLEKAFLDSHTKKMNLLVIKVYAVSCFIPIFVFICCVLDLFHYSPLKALFSVLLSFVLLAVMILYYKKKPDSQRFKYFAAITIQTIVFSLSLDPNIKITVAYSIMPLITFLYFDPKFSFWACIICLISAITAWFLISDETIAFNHLGVSKKFYLISSGSGLLLEFTAMTLLLCVSSVQTNKFKMSLLEHNVKIRDMQTKVLYSFADLIELRDGTTGEHVKRTSAIVARIANYMVENKIYADKISIEDLHCTVMAAPLHDIGKIKVPDYILSKPAPLNEEEYTIIKNHPVESERIIRRTLNNVEDNHFVNIASEVSLYHHEKWDGTGYPKHLKGEEIPVSARIMAIADVFDALCSERPYKEAFSVEKAFQILEESREKHFDPVMVDIMVALRPVLEGIYEGKNPITPSSPKASVSAEIIKRLRAG
ncbi:MAG: HD domain-containing protein [Spirochaetaceae bacterium]|nr:HD domain-containing protein [Spirochaetaceae bacterium]